MRFYFQINVRQSLALPAQPSYTAIYQLAITYW